MSDIVERYAKQEIEKLQKIIDEKREQVKKFEISRNEFYWFTHGLFKSEIEALLDGQLNTDLD